MFKNKIDKPLGKFLDALSITLISCLMVFIDNLFCAFVFPGKVFVWIAFASMTVFSTLSFKDRVKALPGYIIGAVASIAIMSFSTAIFALIKFEINGHSMTSCIASLIVIFIVMMLYEFKLLKFTSITGIFVGAWLLFSGLGFSMYPNSFLETLIIFAIIIGYSFMGLVAGNLSIYIHKRINKIYEKDKSDLNNINVNE